ncbi:cupredoxin domain-containing protein [Lactobacillus equicursoris]|uniref:cupredoxin domain-containing protein n=1 Tax=Lactobacillus equicursoris TaxID=420645 RepID=UPI00242AE538|nr:cupredoxin domain-containing protein [Lactobacillus equicursoris]MDD6385876.1 cupredoxin domain-containing protein [Lactobacillus equicursoris]
MFFSNKQKQTIVVDKGYEPSEIHFKQGKPAEITFKVKTDNACLREVDFKSLDQKMDLFAPGKHQIAIPTDHKGEIPFVCGMDMFHGKIVVD